MLGFPVQGNSGKDSVMVTTMCSRKENCSVANPVAGWAHAANSGSIITGDIHFEESAFDSGGPLMEARPQVE